MDSLKKLTDVREYNLCSKEYGTTLVKEYVPKDVCRKIKSKNLTPVERDRVLFFLAVLIGLCQRNGSNKVKISSAELGDYLHMKHGFAAKARDFLVMNGLIEAHKRTGGTEFVLKFNVRDVQESNYSVQTSDDGVERILCEPVVEEKHEMTVDDLISVVEMQEGEIFNMKDEISTLTSENDTLKEKVKELEEQLGRLTVDESSKKIEEAKEKSPLFSSAIDRFKSLFS